jgi:hypothetical protein
MKVTPESLSNQPNLFPTSKDLQDLLRENCKTAVLKLGLELLEQGVRSFCGEPFSRKADGQFHRGGSEMTSMIVDGGKIYSMTRCAKPWWVEYRLATIRK